MYIYHALIDALSAQMKRFTMKHFRHCNNRQAYIAIAYHISSVTVTTARPILQ